MTDLFSSLSLGDLLLPNRVVMAPLTRMRSQQPGNIPWTLNAEYYAQRAGAGLIISEATQISQQGQGYPHTPGIYSSDQTAGWKVVTDAVHASGGRMFLQLWHVGRISHSSFQPDGGLPVAPSAIAPQDQTMTATWKMAPYETPRALETAEIPGLVDSYRQAAENAKAAGFDGVEIHAANGYLLDQFLQDGSNKRTDRYGGDIVNRSRLLLEVTEAVAGVWDTDRIGVRLSPYGTFNDMHDSDTVALFSHVLKELSAKHIGYAHIIEPRATSAGGSDTVDDKAPVTSRLFRDQFTGVLISAGGYSRETAIQAVAEGWADAIAFGRLFIANPDLPERLRSNMPLNRYDRATFYGGNAKGYTDYPYSNAAA
jgi:N-ethylmaleimide reductase